MTNDQLKKLENDLWASANSLRAYGGLKAADYAVPVLGLIFLRFADNKYGHYENEILAEFNKTKGTRRERSIESIALATCGFYLPDYARYDFLLKLSGDKSMAKALSKDIEGNEQKQDE
jgi:type I restriction enzyme M protein